MEQSNVIFSISEKVDFYETDASGSVFFLNHIKWFDIAVLELWKNIGIDIKSIVEDGRDLGIKYLSVNYNSPLYLGDCVTVNITNIKVGQKSLTVYGELHCKDNLIASLKIVYVHIDLKKGISIKIPDSIKEKFS